MKILIKIYAHASKYKLHITIAAITTLLVTGVNLITPRIMQNMVKVLQTETDTAVAQQRLVQIALILLAIFVVRAFLQFVSRYVGHYGAWHYISEMRVKVYSQLQRLSIGYYSDKQTGQLMSRVINDTANFEMLIAHAVPDMVSGIVLFVGVTIILFATNATLALFTLIPVPFILFTRPVFRKIRRSHSRAQEYIAELNAQLQDNFSGIKEIQIFNRQDAEEERIKSQSDKHANTLVKMLLYSAVMHPIIEFATSMGNVIVVGVGGYLVLNNMGMSLDEIVGFLLYISVFYAPVGQASRLIEDMQSGIASGERVFEILDTESDVEESPHACDAGTLRGEIEFRDVDFNYGSDESETVLKSISFRIPEKKMYAVIGATGVGKTTLAALLPRFYDVTSGEILIDGINIKDMTLTSLRRNISIVLQDVFLFNGSISDNIRYADPEVSDDEVINAAKTACIHDFIESLPLGYDTVVGERGMRLSGGQKQRVSIARSLLRNSPILILDEATSAVDTETEREIRAAVQRIAGSQSKTLIVIAHRLSTVKQADCIIVLKDGMITESGTHSELMEKGGVYKNLVEIQSIKD
ncbi:MAG: ABC transporter ATP-binding protein/permease [Oscillospiraceae bacterium]|nr:ABC transporter ATP-binding protein/permease [Oscillospiraceae bacterium]